MSNTQYAFLMKSRVPSREALQASIDQLGFDMQVDPELNLLDDVGFSPCQLNGMSDFGFELFAGNSDDEDFQDVAGDNDFYLSFSWGGRMEDLACTMIVSCALAKDFGAIISYEGDEPDSFDEMLSSTTEILDDLKNGTTDGGVSDVREDVTPPGVEIQIAGGGRPIGGDYFQLLRRQMALMELWVAGTITGKQRAELAEVDAALFKLKNH